MVPNALTAWAATPFHQRFGDTRGSVMSETMKSVYTVTRSAPTGDELISVWGNSSAQSKEAKSLVPFEVEERRGDAR
jgi:hypothetical protein